MFYRDRQLMKVPLVLLIIFWLMILSLSVIASSMYPGQKYVYVIFTIIANALLYFGFRSNAIFFDTFIGIFFWLGFWLKLSLRVAFTKGLFHDVVGHFDGSGTAFDRALLVTSCGFLGLLVASFIREKLIFNYPKKIEDIAQEGLRIFYQANRTLILTGFLFLILVVSVSNINLGIYQRGAIPKTILPYGLGGVYKWLLLFGLASFSALMLKFELEIPKRTSYVVVLLSLFESFCSSVSLLSRGMILNTSALFYGLMKSLKYQLIKTRYTYIITIFVIFVIMFGGSVVAVNNIRAGSHSSVLELDTPVAKGTMAPLFIDRWVGIEGVMAVSSYPKLGWGLWSEAWKEVYSDYSLSFYDKTLVVSQYANLDTTKHHYISLPGILAFCFYPGSYLFLFGCMFLAGIVAVAIEVSVFKFGGSNAILCSLLAQVIAYRYASFGYVPAQSYLLFGTIYLNLFLIYFADKFLAYRNRRNLQ